MPISLPIGLLWLLSALCFLIVAVLFAIGENRWGFVAIPSVFLSQVLIILSWSDAKFGTIPNIVILVISVIGLGSFFIQNQFEKTVKADIKNNNTLATEILTEKDIAHLPTPVQKYLRYTKAVGRPKVKNFRAEFVGWIRSSGDSNYMNFHSTQYNFFQSPSRYFYITASKRGFPATALHLYQKEKATFVVKLLNWFPVIDAKGKKMTQGETVTLFNDMCFMAPATLIDKHISWEKIDDLIVKAVYRNGDYVISATLYFNEKGELVNFISNDRFETDGKKYENYPWETPVTDYKELKGYILPRKAKMIYKKPDGDFTYGEFEFKDLKYNVSDFNW